MTEPDQPLDPSWNSGHYEALGALVHAWSTMEGALALRIANVGGNPRLTLCLTAQIGAANRLLDALISICREAGADETTIGELDKIAGQLGELQRKRNRFIHDAWDASSDPSMPAMWKISADKKLAIERVHTPNKELHDFIIKIHKFHETNRRLSRKRRIVSSIKARTKSSRALSWHCDTARQCE
jgi:hypothetical protein